MLPVRAVPNASRDEVIGWETGELKVKVRAVPEDGKANKALLRFLSKQTGCSRSALELVAGSTSRHKRIAVHGMSRECFFQALGVATQVSDSDAQRA